MFVDFDGKKTLIVNYPLSSINQINESIIVDFTGQINIQLKDYLGEELIDTLTPNFTTTDKDYLTICKMSIMGAFKEYFEYEMHEMGCGIPYIILEGNYEDYEKIIAKAEKLKKYKFDWYINRIIPHIKKMVEAKKGNIDYSFFKNIVEDSFEYESRDLSGHVSYNSVDAISGWILSFFAYYSNNNYGPSSLKFTPFDGKSIKITKFKELADQILKVPFKVVSPEGNFFFEYNVGFIGCDQNEKNEVFPVTGWFITEGKKGEEKEDNNDDNNKSECDINFEELFKQNDRQKIPNYSRHGPIHIPKFGHQRHLRNHFFLMMMMIMKRMKKMKMMKEMMNRDLY